MELDQLQAKIKASVWQAVAQSGIDLKSVPVDQQNQFIDAITENLMRTMDDLLDEVPKPQPISPEGEEQGKEEVLWQGRPFLSLVESYTITSERIRITKGMVGKDFENFELVRVQDLDIEQSIPNRMVGVGDIRVIGHDSSDPKIILRNVKDPHGVYELLRKAWLAARKRHGLQFREMM
jgi:hypothetical protein